ncbi:uncharacterized protein HaLaN_01920 [Haematococcus lacustris]|uniref:methionyl-tRNA formyltransferase n=1 Tax=Haematococcus lacustris TaxID=44745 RepID=A0A699YM71_HAELA|nr:uncharacterized protein HaLaN_01920 [Haematococcus lacustris]
MSSLEPDLCVTAAYGNMLPQRFLDLPRLGTLNIHPSLLPKFRGAAPVQRAVLAGVSETGVSLAYTVLRCDAGPVLAQEQVAVDPEVQAPELLADLFRRGALLLLKSLPAVWDGSAQPWQQKEEETTHAAKLSKEDSPLDFFTCPAAELHNRVRALAGWPGTTARFSLVEESSAL